jgi:hypothetical protein
MGRPECSHLARRRPDWNPVWSTVKAHPVDRRVVDGGVVDDGSIHDGAVVNIVDVNIADVVHRPVVVELIAVPVTTLVAASNIAKTVVDAAVKADVPAPVTMEKGESATSIAPVSWGPESAIIRRCSPRTGNPVVAFRSVVPVPRSPEISRRGNGRLLVFR